MDVGILWMVFQCWLVQHILVAIANEPCKAEIPNPAAADLSVTA